MDVTRVRLWQEASLGLQKFVVVLKVADVLNGRVVEIPEKCYNLIRITMDDS